MPKHCPENERIKRRYFAFLKEAMRHSEPTVDAAANALHRFEDYTRYRNFKAFNIEQAVGFKRHLAEQKAAQSGVRLSKATLHATLTQLKSFFRWLARESGYKSCIRYSDAEYFNLSQKDARVATAQREQRIPTLEQIEHVLRAMPSRNDVELRNRALVAFTLLTGARDSATASMKMKHVDTIRKRVFQDAREVNTKFSKTFYTDFFPVSAEATRIVEDWISYLRTEKLWGNDDPLFPVTRIVLDGHQQFAASGLERAHWSTASPIRSVFREAFQIAGLPYFNPHSFRKTLVQLGQDICKSPEEFKAWSQNLGHEGVLTTFLSYGTVGGDRQSEIFRRLRMPPQEDTPSIEEIVRAVSATLRDAGVEAQAKPS